MHSVTVFHREQFSKNYLYLSMVVFQIVFAIIKEVQDEQRKA